MPKSIIISSINLGVSHSANSAIFEIAGLKLITSASLMVPCPWARQATTSTLKNTSIGIQLTLNSECKNYRWAPITQSPSLLDGNGGFPSTLQDLWDHADPEEVYRECRAQIERASLWGVEISHLGSHIDALLPRPEYFDVLLELGREFDLPIRLDVNTDYGFPAGELVADANIICPDEVIRLEADTDIPQLVGNIKEQSSVVEIVCSPMLDTPEAQAIYPESYLAATKIKEKLEELNAELKTQEFEITDWKELSSKKKSMA